MSKTEQVMEYLRAHPGSTTADLARDVDEIDSSTIAAGLLHALHKTGRVTREEVLFDDGHKRMVYTAVDGAPAPTKTRKAKSNGEDRKPPPTLPRRHRSRSPRPRNWRRSTRSCGCWRSCWPRGGSPARTSPRPWRW